MISTCTCSNDYQDKLYGKYKRVFNAMGINGKSGGRCTSCGKEDKSLAGLASKVSKNEKQSK